jgi:hypothetical protein
MAETGDQAEEAAPAVTKSGEKQEPEPGLDDDVLQRIVDSGLLPSPQVRAQSPRDDSMTGGARADGSQASERHRIPCDHVRRGDVVFSAGRPRCSDRR